MRAPRRTPRCKTESSFTSLRVHKDSNRSGHDAGRKVRAAGLKARRESGPSGAETARMGLGEARPNGASTRIDQVCAAFRASKAHRIVENSAMMRRATRMVTLDCQSRIFSCMQRCRARRNVVESAVGKRCAAKLRAVLGKKLPFSRHTLASLHCSIHSSVDDR
jgi:hypothetical protein